MILSWQSTRALATTAGRWVRIPIFTLTQKQNTSKTIFECRGIIINERFWNRIRDELLDLMKESGPLILYQLGLSYGLDVGARGKDIVDDPQIAVKFLEFYGLMAGLGRFETSGFEFQSDKVEGMTVKVYDSFFANSAKSMTGNPSCFFVSGLLAGIADGLFGPCHNCIEKNCTSAGSECCVFFVTAA